MVSAAHIQQVLTRHGALGNQSASLQTLADGANEAMRMAGINTVNRAAGFLSQMMQESGWLRYTQELGTGQSYAPYIGRTFMQLTGSSNYSGFGSWANARGLVSSASAFTSNPQSLAMQKWAWLGGVYYFTVPTWSGRNLVQICDDGDILKISRAVNMGSPTATGTPGGMSTRTSLWNAWRALGGSILPSITSGDVPGGIAGTPQQVIDKAMAEVGLWGDRRWCYAWPRLRELGKGSEYWCADVVWYVFWKSVGYNLRDHISNPSYVPNLKSFFDRDNLWNQVTFATAKKGDVFILRRRVSGGAWSYYHCGIVRSDYNPTDKSIGTVEGNTSTPAFPGSESTGGVLAAKTRYAAYTDALIYRPTYSTTPIVIDTDTSDPIRDGQTAKPELVGGVTTGRQTERMKSVDEARRLTAIRAASPSPSFLQAIRESHTVTAEADLCLGDRVVADLTPFLVVDESEVANDSSAGARRTAKITLRPGQGDTSSDRLFSDLEATPGYTVQVRSGIRYASGATELVPVHTGLVEKVNSSLPGGRIQIDSPDLARWLVRDAFWHPTPTDPRLSAADMITQLVKRVDPLATVWDQTPTGLPLPLIALEGTYMDNITRLAMSIGAEFYASPVPHLYILRPIASILSRPKWQVDSGILLEQQRSVDWSQVFNSFTVKAERADAQPAEGTWEDTDPRSPLRVQGPFKRNHAKWTSSALITSEDCTAAAKALVDRFSGSRTRVSWSQLRNPMVETGDVCLVNGQYRVILDRYTLPLGGKPMTADARSLQIEGVSAE